MYSVQIEDKVHVYQDDDCPHTVFEDCPCGPVVEGDVVTHGKIPEAMICPETKQVHDWVDPWGDGYLLCFDCGVRKSEASKA